MPKHLIGRFEVLKELGKGGQGAVFLAYDPQLDRQVAIKTLLRPGHKTEQLVHEARIVSKLQHPNIIALYDAGKHQGTSYLVYAYIEGVTLAQLLKKEKTLSLARAAEIASGVLDGLAYAHAQGISHLDIKPANIMISSNGTPMVMDFGMAKTANDQTHHDETLRGTPRYVAPEIIHGQAGDFLADIYAVGTLLYEMVTGEFAVRGESLFEILNRAAHERVSAPSNQNDTVDEELESIILKAVAKKPEGRYPSAMLMRQALQEYLGEARVPVVQGSENSTVDFLLRRMRTKRDFPAITTIITEINQIVSSESTSASKLARTILQDFALTNKLLKQVNSATYGHFGGTINTISKAVAILGFETVRSIASSLILIEFLKNKTQSSELKDEVVKSIFSGMVAAQLSSGLNICYTEEVTVCSMFHNLGKMLGIYYFFDESQEIARLIDQGKSEDNAAHKVLGVSYTDLGLGVARSWNFPSTLIAGMRKLAPDKITATHGGIDEMTVMANLAHELCEISASTDAREKSQLLRNLSKRYENVTKVSEQSLSNALNAGLNELARRSAVLGISTAKNPMIKKARQWSATTHPAEQTKNEKSLDGIVQLEQTAVTEKDEGVDARNRPNNSEALLGAGIQDVTTSLVSEFKLNDILQMILETMYRGMGFNRALILFRDNLRGSMVARFGFGEGIEALIPCFHFPLPYAPDVFHLAITKGLDIAIEDTNAANIVDKIPSWYRTAINAPCFVLLPVMLKDKAIGLFYADMPIANSLDISQQQLSLLCTLRNQAVLAIKQKT